LVDSGGVEGGHTAPRRTEAAGQGAVPNRGGAEQARRADYTRKRVGPRCPRFEMVSIEGRQIGWVTTPPTQYIRPVRRIAVRCRKQNGQWGVGVLISTIDPEHILMVTNLSPFEWVHFEVELLAYVYFYDQRGGGVESNTGRNFSRS
jgi:hypothetical protein